MTDVEAIGAHGQGLADAMRLSLSDDDDDPGEPLEPAVQLSRHQPRRPDWRCRSCDREWPCVPAREYMLVAWEPVSRAVTMAGYFLQACEDLAYAPAGELYRRFLGWVRNA